MGRGIEQGAHDRRLPARERVTLAEALVSGPSDGGGVFRVVSGRVAAVVATLATKAGAG